MGKKYLSAGLCDNCIYCGIIHEGSGIDEPFQSMPYCSKLNIEVIPVNDKHKEMRVINCETYLEQSDTNI